MTIRHCITLLGSVIAPLAFTGCVYTATQLNQVRQQAYRSGLADGKAAQVRQDYHDEQWARGLPESTEPMVLPPKRLYQVPIPEHIASDGVKIEAHTLPIQVLQP